MSILLIDACVRTHSRTKRLSDFLLRQLPGDIEILCLEKVSFPKVDEAFLQQRDALIASGRFDAPLFSLARQFAQAEQIVIAAPYWDLSFPAVLKQYFEQINVLGITFEYTPKGMPRPLCHAKRLFYVTTAGGTYVPMEFGFGYIQALARSFYGISDVRLIQATGLDIDGADEEQILQKAIAE